MMTPFEFWPNEFNTQAWHEAATWMFASLAVVFAVLTFAAGLTGGHDVACFCACAATVCALAGGTTAYTTDCLDDEGDGDE